MAAESFYLSGRRNKQEPEGGLGMGVGEKMREWGRVRVGVRWKGIGGRERGKGDEGMGTVMGNGRNGERHESKGTGERIRR